MTATILPPANVPHLTRIDPEVRLRDYCCALKFYLSTSVQLIPKLLFVENSGADLDALRGIVHRRANGRQVELISFNGLDYPSRFGRGYGEFKLLDHAMLASTSLNSSDVIWKVTGRIRVVNIEKLIRSAPDSYDVYCDLSDAKLFGERLGKTKWMELRIFSTTPSAYRRYFMGRFHELREGDVGCAERYWFRRIQELATTANIIPRFNIEPIYAGHFGGDGRDYGAIRERLRSCIRALMRQVQPTLWI